MLQIHFYPRSNIVYLVYVEKDGTTGDRVQLTKILHDELVSNHNVKRVVIRD